MSDAADLREVGGKDLGIRFGDCDVGWIRLWIDALDPPFPIAATHLCDPFTRFVQWLEEISEGAKSSVWSVSEEGSLVRLLFVAESRLLDQGPDRLVFLRDWDGGHDLRSVAIGRRDLVGQFYAALTAFQCDGYKPAEWEYDWAVGHAEDEMSEEQFEALTEWPCNPWHGAPLSGLRSMAVERFLSREVAAQLDLPLG